MQALVRDTSPVPSSQSVTDNRRPRTPPRSLMDWRVPPEPFDALPHDARTRAALPTTRAAAAQRPVGIVLMGILLRRIPVIRDVLHHELLSSHPADSTAKITATHRCSGESDTSPKRLQVQ